jgi:drug/metabolite transporter (DMT)-like permease
VERTAAPGGRLRARAAGRLGALPAGRRGALIYIVAGMVFVATDSLTKSLVSGLPVIDVVFGRHVTYVLAIVLLAGRTTPRRLVRTSRRRLQLLRGLTMFGVTASFFVSLSLLPLAEVSTLASTTPLWVVALAGPVLGERVTRSAVIGALVGFAGVVVLVGIDPAQLQVAMLLPLANGLLYAIFSMLTRKLRAEHPDVTMFYSGIVGLILSTVLYVLIPTGVSPEPSQWIGIGIVGLSALVGHRLLVAAYRWGRASDLAPLGYLSLVWSFLSGALIFHEPIELRAVVGALGIASGGAMALRASPDQEEPSGRSVDQGELVDLERPSGIGHVERDQSS